MHALVRILPLLLPLVAPSTSGLDEVDEGIATIEESTVEETVRLLSSASFEGRDSPSPGLLRAQRFVVERLSAAGFVPAADSKDAWERVLGGTAPPSWAVHGEGGIWLRPYRTLALSNTDLERPDPDRSYLGIAIDDRETEAFAFGKDFMPIAGCGGDVRGELVFAGFGIQSKRERYDDLKSLRLAGKVALIYEGEPRHSKRFEGEEVTPEASLWDKLQRLEEERVAGVLVVRRPLEEEAARGGASEETDGEPLSFRSTYARWQNEPNDPRPRDLPPALLVSMDCASRLLGKDADKIVRSIDRRAKPVKERLDGRRVSLRSITSPGAADLFNVVGLLEGSGATEEAVVVGAHADHIGVGPRGRIAHGADDNASGVAALCEVAEALAATPPSRSVYCVSFSAEEDGLIGSREFCAAPPIPAADMVAMLNLDMIGRGKSSEVVVLGEVQNPGITKVLDKARRAGKTGIRSIDYCNDPGLFQRSDHFNFHQAGVPTIFFFENYPISQNEDYHTWRDQADHVDMDKVTNTARLAYVTAWMLANDDKRLPPPRD